MKKFFILTVMAAIAVLTFTQCTKMQPDTPALDVTLSQQSIQLSCTEPLTVDYAAENVKGVLTMTVAQGNEDIVVVNEFNPANATGRLILTTTKNNQAIYNLALIFKDETGNCPRTLTVTTKSVWSMVIDSPVDKDGDGL